MPYNNRENRSELPDNNRNLNNKKLNADTGKQDNNNSNLSSSRPSEAIGSDNFANSDNGLNNPNQSDFGNNDDKQQNDFTKNNNQPNNSTDGNLNNNLNNSPNKVPDKSPNNTGQTLDDNAGVPKDYSNALSPDKLNDNGNNKKAESPNDKNKKADNPDDNKKNTDNLDNLKDSASDGASSGAMAGLNAASNLSRSTAEAGQQDTEQNLKDIVADTARAAPMIVADIASGNVPSLVKDTVGLGSKIITKLIKVIPVLVIIVVLLAASIFSMVGVLPSLIFGGLGEAIEERQVNKAQTAIEEFYEDRISEVVSELIKNTKSDADIGSFSTWKRVVAGKNDNYSVSVTRVNETDAVIKINNIRQNTGLLITFENIYLADYSSLKVDKVALLNSYAYETSYSDTAEYQAGKQIPLEQLFSTEEESKWRRKDTQGLKDWLKLHKDELVTYSVTETSQVVQNGVTYRQLKYDVGGVITADEIYNAHSFSEEQKEQLRTMSFAGDMYLAACDDSVPDGTESLLFNIYPKIDVYTNLVGGSDNLIWSMTPSDYKHLIADNDETGTALLIKEFITTAKAEQGYTGTVDDSSKYNQWYGTDNVPWNSTFLSWSANQVDEKIDTEINLLENVIPKTNDVNYMTGFLFNNNYTWHYSSDNYTPQAGDIVVIYSPQQTITEDGTVITTDTLSVSETHPELNVADADLRVTSLGLVETATSGSVLFICGDTTSEMVEVMSLDLTDSKIVAYVTPNYESVAGDTLMYDGDILDKGDYLFPLRGTCTVSALYGFYPSGGTHSGVDFACPVGTPVVAANSGVVTKVDNACTTTYGIYVRIESELSSGVTSAIYAHLSQSCVSVGQTVSAGDVIALSGNTGNSTGPHLHFGVKNKNGVNVNPIAYLRNRNDIKLHATITN